ncbi:hypothetical protein L9F63_005051, partial [Diploptera punctata]
CPLNKRVRSNFNMSYTTPYGEVVKFTVICSFRSPVTNGIYVVVYNRLNSSPTARISHKCLPTVLLEYLKPASEILK